MIIIRDIHAAVVGLMGSRWRLFIGVVEATFVTHQAEADQTPEQPMRVLYDADRQHVRHTLKQSVAARKAVTRNYKRANGEPTLKELRSCALAYLCAYARKHDIDLSTVNLCWALDMLDEANRLAPELYASRWYRLSAENDSQWTLFKREWKACGGLTTETRNKVC